MSLLPDLEPLEIRHFEESIGTASHNSPFRPADLLIGEIRDAVGALDLHRIPKAGHWSAYENAPEVNRLLLEFFGGGAA